MDFFESLSPSLPLKDTTTNLDLLGSAWTIEKSLTAADFRSKPRLPY